MSWLYSIIFAGLLFTNHTDPASPVKAPEPSVHTVETVAQDETERFEQTYPLNSNGRVSVSNVNGSITVTAWDRNEVRLVAVKRADSKERLADVEIKIESKPEYLRVETEYNDWKYKSKTSDGQWRDRGKLTVDYELSVPRTAMLNEIETVNGSVSVSDFVNFTKISAVNGTVKAANLRGTADLSTVNGQVNADFERLETGSKISLSTVNGTVDLAIPSDASATIKADSLNGNITNDFGLPVRKGRYVGRDLYGRLGSGDVTIKLGSVNGALTVKRRNDGRNLSPATDLLPTKNAEDEIAAVEKDKAKVKVDTEKVNREVERAVREAQRDAQQAIRDAEKEIARVQPAVEVAVKEAAKVSIDAARVGLEAQRAVLAAMRNVSFIPGQPRIEAKSDSIPVKGKPRVSVEAKGCSVHVRGWDKQEVKYSVIQYSNQSAPAPVQVSENHSDSTVNIKVINETSNGSVTFNPEGPRTRIEIFVPRKTDLKINSDREIRLEGVSGELNIQGGDENVNVRDSEGKLTVANEDGLVRVIGFKGEAEARTVDGEIFLEGDFERLSGRAADGTIVLTLPEGSAADITSNRDVMAEGLELVRSGERNWRFGAGGPKYNFEFADGKLIVRGTTMLSVR